MQPRCLPLRLSGGAAADKTVLVTGGVGYIGSHTVLELLQAGTSTVGFSLALITFSLVRSASQFLTSCTTQHGVNDRNIRF